MRIRLVVAFIAVAAASFAGTLSLSTGHGAQPVAATPRAAPKACAWPITKARAESPGYMLKVFVRANILRVAPECSRLAVSERWLAIWPESGNAVQPYDSAHNAEMVFGADTCEGLRAGACWEVVAAARLPANRTLPERGVIVFIALHAPDAEDDGYRITMIRTARGWRVDSADALGAAAAQGPLAS